MAPAVLETLDGTALQPLHAHISDISFHDALDFLESEWPKVHGAYHDAALASCRNALRRQTPPAVTKELFLAACLEAGIAIRGGSRRASGQRLSETVHRHF